jgi:hypothetical protein
MDLEGLVQQAGVVDMTFSEIAQVITAAAALGAVIISARNGRKIQEVHLSINSRMDQLLKAAEQAAHAAGAAEARLDK